jgi:hypothetical protein
MSTLEKKLCTAMAQLIDEVIDVHPDLKRPLVKVQNALRKLAA